MINKHACNVHVHDVSKAHGDGESKFHHFAKLRLKLENFIHLRYYIKKYFKIEMSNLNPVGLVINEQF